MSFKTLHRTLLVSCALCIAVAMIGVILFRYWINPIPEQQGKQPKQNGLVDVQPLLTAQRVAALAGAPQEQEFAKNALRVADHEVDMAFAAALHHATEHAPPIPQAAKPILENMQAADRRV